ncbi:MAG TPA: hypothetical protein VFA18_15180 [Gemmataceae bacterium]|nr:hypothetical protein [Gemmataceae bacterium]
MKVRTILLLFVLGLLTGTASSRADEKAQPTSAQRFELLKQLAGDWVEVGKDGKPMDKIISSIRVTAAGTAIQETLLPGTPHEMVTMYHLNGADLILTHYCALGNQPRMRAEPGGDLRQIPFKFFDGTNLKSNGDQHMNQATLTIVNKDHFKAEWLSCKEGKACHHVTFDLVRKQK